MKFKRMERSAKINWRTDNPMGGMME